MKKTETKSIVLLAHHLKSLRLPTILAECEKVAARARPTTSITWRFRCNCVSWN